MKTVVLMFWATPVFGFPNARGKPRANLGPMVTSSEVQTLCWAGHDGIYVLGAENGTVQLWQRDGSVDK